jgi:hypothetical protein
MLPTTVVEAAQTSPVARCLRIASPGSILQVMILQIAPRSAAGSETTPALPGVHFIRAPARRCLGHVPRVHEILQLFRVVAKSREAEPPPRAQIVQLPQQQAQSPLQLVLQLDQGTNLPVQLGAVALARATGQLLEPGQRPGASTAFLRRQLESRSERITSGRYCVSSSASAQSRVPSVRTTYSEISPRPTLWNDLGFVEPDHGFGKSVTEHGYRVGRPRVNRSVAPVGDARACTSR